MVVSNGRFAAFLLLLTCFCDTTSSECTQLTPCSCMFADGHGYDLTQLGNSGPLTASTVNHTFYFQPCKNTPFNATSGDECSKGNGVSLCVTIGNNMFSLGTAEETKITQPDGQKDPLLTLLHATNVSTIELVCCAHCSTVLTVDSSNDGVYHLTLMSQDTCKKLLHAKGLSTGSLLIIYFVVFAGIYFVGGAIVLKLLSGGQGWEIVPNHKFWRELPSLVRDGIAFTFNCCQLSSYDRI
ncbi:uncharacterized protein LOC143376888 [Andrena cerasifolii]|uniref:uncharacterized protein LOC143376888 n=1 Tax=Andrena cerasifolii TaxID=2819439 RepID=UPI00403766FA